ncbi:hypothetical protein GQ53DRAFT_721375 [Thozetella sp. PMI_491]|nr:hypothetical protein GQ53DRAFT_721375 [Thozetella sp. PMI_491]
MGLNILLRLGLALLALAPRAAYAQSDSTVAALATLPSCALTCLIGSIANSPCEATNTTCVCTNAPLQLAVTECVTLNCTVKQGLFTKNVTETICDAPIRDRSNVANGLAIALGTLSGAVVLLRVAFKLWSKLGMMSDDWAIVLTFLAGLPSTVMLVVGTGANGLGKDVWAVPYDSITLFGFYFYIIEIIYFALICLLKMSLLLFFLRIFPTPLVRRLLWGTVALNIMYGLTFIFIGIFQCRPISFYWDKWDGEHQGSCMNINSVGWANAAISIALDVWMLAIPLSQLRSLNLHWKKKIGVGIMFSVGTFVTVVSILRLQSLVSFATSTNLTWDQFDVSNWSTIEINVGIICACLPTMRLILVRLFPKQLGSSQYTNNYHQYASNPKSAGRSRSKTTGEDGSPSSSTNRTIVCQTTYTIEYGDSDGSNLVHLQTLNLKAGQEGKYNRLP